MSRLNDIEKLRGWCHKILPLVYDNSLSYYEVLCKVRAKLNEVIGLTSEQNEVIEEVVQEVTDWETTTDSKYDEFTRQINEDFDDFKSAVNDDIVEYKGDMVDLYNSFLQDYLQDLGIEQSEGQQTDKVMSQKATTDALADKVSTSAVKQVTGSSTSDVMSQKSITDELSGKVSSADFSSTIEGVVKQMSQYQGETDLYNGNAQTVWVNGTLDSDGNPEDRPDVAPYRLITDKFIPCQHGLIVKCLGAHYELCPFYYDDNMELISTPFAYSQGVEIPSNTYTYVKFMIRQNIPNTPLSPSDSTNIELNYIEIVNYNKLKAILENNVKSIDVEWELGAFDADLEYTDNPIRLRTKNFIDVSKGLNIKTTLTSGGVCPIYYDEEFLPVSSPLQYYLSLDIPVNTYHYCKLMANINDSTSPSVTDGNLYISVGIDYTINATPYSLYKGEVETSIEACKEDGYYNILSANVPNISDKPLGLVGRSAIVIVYNKCNDTYGIQILIDTGMNIWIRYFKTGESGITLAWKQLNSADSSFTWYAMGDSITAGYYSIAPNSMSITTENWVKIASEALGCDVTNYGIGGSGYVDDTHATDGKNARQKADLIDFSNCDMVTLAFGINDWKYGYPLGSMSDDVTVGGTLYSNMRYVIEKIINDNPNCKIIVITPLNCMGYDFDYGTELTNWGLGYTNSINGKTLEEFFTGIVEVCNYYGIEYIDMTHYSVVNRKSITGLLLDGVHPSLECYQALGKELSKKINF